jgi:hypothetical protein
MIFGTTPTGMNCAWTLTVTGPPELMTASGKLKGLALIAIPLMLVTLRELGPVVGTAPLNGSDIRTAVPVGPNQCS